MSQRKNLEEIESEVERSLAILNDDLEKLEEASNVTRPEEYRKTLEVLDNVLAEFDDWPSIETGDMNNESNSLEIDVFFPTDDRTHQNSSNFQKGDLPAIPARSPTTRLSEDNNKLLSQQGISLSPPGTRDAVSLGVPESKMSSTTTGIDDERVQLLRSKFHRVRELLKENVIKLLDVDPPSFIPPAPPSQDFCGDFSESSSTSSRQSPTVEDIPNLLPTDVLLRPQFGMTYSLEEDLPPGVKEIHRTSTPKSDVSPSSFSREFGRLSTFSSQSELEVSSNKVPLTSYKSLTLPNGLDRFPFYSHEESSHWRKPSFQKSASNVLSKEEEERKTKKFSFRKFSRKSKTGSVL